MKKNNVLIVAVVAVFFVALMVIMTFEEDLFDDREKIRFWQFWSVEWIQPAIDKFQAENPDYKIEVERLTWDAGFNKIVTAMAADDAPDVLEIGSTWVAGFGSDGGILPLEIGDLQNKLSSWRPALYDGEYYAVPWALSTNALFYNKDLLKKAELNTPPANWNELLDMSTKIHSLGEDLYGYGLKSGRYTSWQKFLPFAWSNGTQLISDDWKSTDVTKPDFIEALTFYQSLKNVGLFDENVNVRKAFQEGSVGFMIEDPGQIKKFRKDTPDLNFGVIQLPLSPKGKSVNFAGAEMLAIGKNTEHKEMAMKFIEFMTRPENTMLITTKITSLFPAHKDAINTEYYQHVDPEIHVFLKTLETAISPPAHPQWVEIQEIFTEGLEKIMYDKGSPADMMQEVDGKIMEVLNTSGNDQ